MDEMRSRHQVSQQIFEADQVYTGIRSDWFRSDTEVPFGIFSLIEILFAKQGNSLSKTMGK
jgi:hypothetical protein